MSTKTAKDTARRRIAKQQKHFSQAAQRVRPRSRQLSSLLERDVALQKIPDRMTFLAKASKVLMSASSATAACHRLAHLLAPAVADYCIVYCADADAQELV